MRPKPTINLTLNIFCTMVSEKVRISSPVPKTGTNVNILGKGVVLSKKTIEKSINIKPTKLNNSPLQFLI